MGVKRNCRVENEDLHVVLQYTESTDKIGVLYLCIGGVRHIEEQANQDQLRDWICQQGHRATFECK